MRLVKFYSDETIEVGRSNVWDTKLVKGLPRSSRFERYRHAHSWIHPVAYPRIISYNQGVGALSPVCLEYILASFPYTLCFFFGGGVVCVGSEGMGRRNEHLQEYRTARGGGTWTRQSRMARDERVPPGK